MQTLKQVTKAYLPLAFTTFGGPAAHISLLHDLFVVREQWISDKHFAELFAIAQALPGPASTQLAYSITLVRHGLLAALWSFVVWSLPGMLAMTAFALFLKDSVPKSVVKVEASLASAAVGLVALAATKLSVKLIQGKLSALIALFSFCFAILNSQWAYMSPFVMITGGFIGWIYQQFSTYKQFISVDSAESTADEENPQMDLPTESSDSVVSVTAIALFLVLLVLSIYGRSSQNKLVSLASTFYFVGSIIFGGGPVVIPLLYSYLVTSSGWMTEKEFLLGLAIINAMPGPMFNFSAYCGALIMSTAGAFTAWAGIFLPGLLLKTALIPFWKRYRDLEFVKPIMEGVNSAAIGLVYSAVFLLYNKAVAESSVHASIAAFAFVAVGLLELAAPLVIFFTGLASILVLAA